jgi:hypothetical protein
MVGGRVPGKPDWGHGEGTSADEGGSAMPPRPAFAPIRFDLVGLADWYGRRFIVDFRGQLGPDGSSRPTTSVTLGHADEAHLITVCTAGRQDWDDEANDKHREGHGAYAFAQGALFSLVDLRTPRHQTDEQWRGYAARIWSYASQHANEWTEWEPAEWSRAGERLHARLYRFANAWTGLTVGDLDRYIGVTAVGPVDTHIALAEVIGEPYG